MPKLYVSDLDGTLLRSDATLSDFSRQQLARMLDEGLEFTVASARSVVSMQMLLAGLPLRLPVIEMNGAMISDLASGHHQIVHAIEPEMLRNLCAFLRERGHALFVSSVAGDEDHLYYAEVSHEGMAWYVENRVEAQDPRLRHVDALEPMLGEQVVTITLIERHDVAAEVIEAVRERFGEGLAANFFENGYSPGWYWLTLHDPRATKDQAIRELVAMRGFDAHDLVVFGDHWNDLPMFGIAGTAIAVANAAEEVKAQATVVIGPNDDDSVVKWIAEHQ